MSILYVLLHRYFMERADFAICYTSCYGNESRLTGCSIQSCSLFYDYYTSICYGTAITINCSKEHLMQVKICYCIFLFYR